MDAASAELKAAGIERERFGPTARDGRRFAALERARDFAAVAKRYATVLRRKSEAEAQQREMFRLLQTNNANHRARQRAITEMSTQWRTLFASTAATEAAIKSQNLKLAEEHLSAAEAALTAMDRMMATARQRGGQISHERIALSRRLLNCILNRRCAGTALAFCFLRCVWRALVSSFLAPLPDSSFVIRDFGPFGGAQGALFRARL